MREKENSYVYDRTLFLGGGVEECMKTDKGNGPP